MKKLTLFIISIILLSSCTNIMEQKVSTKGYEDYKKVLYEIDTLDSREKEYIVAQSKEMIIEAGIAEKAMEAIGLKRDTADISTFGEYYYRKSIIWRRNNDNQRAIMERNIILDTAIVSFSFFDVNVSIASIENCKGTTKIERSWGSDYSWTFDYNLKITGNVIVKHNVKNLQSFVPKNDLSLYGNPTFKKINDSIFEFTSIYNRTFYLSYGTMPISEHTDISESDLKYYWENNYLPLSVLQEEVDVEVVSKEKSLQNTVCSQVKFGKISRRDNYPISTSRTKEEFLNEAEYQEFHSIYNDETDSSTIRKLKVKYGMRY